MQWDWTTIVIVQVLIWLIVIFEWKQLKKSSKTDKITFAAILSISTLLSFFNLEDLPGPISLLHYIFGPLGKMME
ncbi:MULTISPECIES: hypothetical protein [unclassified Cytobacillus]|uniref:hypothetical protein n=1 Tax=unclassified Cytobacillus TaxID=2675268 RepID=UPI00203D02EB|nr:hypothetical protein [Cytobacillus sp. AMY 15.2]MCM3089749.1 hypothetical protein [Cytobacillus sp. AMY 15.2]